MKLFTKICLILALVLAVLGGVLLPAGLAAGASAAALCHAFHVWQGSGHSFVETGDLSTVFGLEEEDDDDQNRELSKSGSGSYDAQTVAQIVLDIKAGEIHIYPEEEKSDGSIRVQTKIPNRSQSIVCSADMAGGVLSVSEKTADQAIGNLKKYAKVFVYLPQGYQPEKMEIHTGDGDICIHGALAAGELQIFGTSGDVTTDAGITADRLVIEQDFGEVELSGRSQINQSADIASAAGDICIEDMTCQGNAKLETSMGDLEYEGVVGGDLTARADMGDVEIRLLGEPERYNYDIACALGDLVFNGQRSYGPTHHIQMQNDPGAGTITVNCDLGDVELEVR